MLNTKNNKKKDIKKAAYWQQNEGFQSSFSKDDDWNPAISWILSRLSAKVKQSCIKFSLRHNPSSNGCFYA